MKKFISAIMVMLIIAGVSYFVWDYWYKPPPVVITADPATERVTNTGKVVGYKENNNTHAWLGVPFAKPPVGELRWKSPLPPDRWEDTLEALEFCHACTQIGGPLGNVPPKYYGKAIGSEDCLYLNIWSPEFSPEDIPSAGDRLPVMVWIHGGGNSIGHGGGYNGKYLAEKYDVMVVTINYRLGPFGWFTHPALREKGTPPEDQSGNYGTLDIIRALTWVKHNIAGFGGDPNNVTIFGESAGALNTLSMVLSPKAKGLFHKAISQSGMARSTTFPKGENYKDDNVPGHAFSSREVINKLLIADNVVSDRKAAAAYQNKMSGGEIAEYLRKKNNLDLLRVYSAGPFGMISMPMLFQDGEVIPKGNALELFKNTDNYNPVPIILGTNRDEFKLFMSQNPEFVKRYLGIIVRFKDRDFYELFSQYKSDAWKAIGVDEIASRLSESQEENVYGYRFDWDEEPAILGMDMSMLVGAAHGLEISFVFNNFDRGLGLLDVLFTDDNLPGRKALANSMSSYWAEFAYTGSPKKGRNGEEFEWQAWDSSGIDSDKFIIFDTPEGGGLRMSSDIITLIDLKNGLLEETSFPSREKHCATYVSLFKDTPLWNDQEYESLGGQ